MSEQSNQEEFWSTVENYTQLVREELAQYWASWQIDLMSSEVHEVIGGLMGRQVTLVTQLAQAPSIWNGHVAPLFLRTMTDTYITLAWILEDPVDRSRKFILHGLGEEKLLLEHHKSRLKEADESVDDHPLVQSLEAWLNSQRFTFLTEVNVGSWSGIDTRSMAQEADSENLYTFAYRPFSAATHSMWQHIERYNLEECSNPLHRLHRIPSELDAPLDVDYLYRAAKYVKESFDVFRQKIGVGAGIPSAFDMFVSELARFDAQGEDDDSTPASGFFLRLFQILPITSHHRVNQEYSVVVHKAEEGGYWVEVPALAGCYSQGETVEEALANVKEAIELYLETLRERGESPPNDATSSSK